MTVGPAVGSNDQVGSIQKNFRKIWAKPPDRNVDAFTIYVAVDVDAWNSV